MSLLPVRVWPPCDHLNQGQEADPEGVNSGITAPESTAYTKRMRPSDNPPRGTPESCF